MKFIPQFCAPLLVSFCLAALARSAELIRPKVVVTTFEIGADTGDKPGEFQFWVEREQLTGTLTVAGLDHPVRFNDRGVYGVVRGHDGARGAPAHGARARPAV